MQRADNRGEHLYWVCRCDCGQERLVASDNLKSGCTVSCGCLRKEKACKHGKRHSSEYVSWDNMMRRCLNVAHPRYSSYGGRGITVCEAWRDFTNFYADMGPKPTLRHTIERVDNDLGYFKANCKWATYKEQAANRRPRTTKHER